MLRAMLRDGVAPHAWQRRALHDTTSPFHPSAVESHVRAAFLIGCDGPRGHVAAAAGTFTSLVDVNTWAAKAVGEEASAELLEVRAWRICARLTRDLPRGHAARAEAPDVDYEALCMRSAQAHCEVKLHVDESLTATSFEQLLAETRGSRDEDLQRALQKERGRLELAAQGSPHPHPLLQMAAEPARRRA